MTAAFRISSSVFFQTPPLIMIRMVVDGAGARGRPVYCLRGLCGGAARRAALRALGAAARSSAARPARLGHLLGTAPRGGGASAATSAGLAGLAEMRTPVSQP